MKKLSIEVNGETYEIIKEMAKETSQSIPDVAIDLLRSGLEYEVVDKEIRKNEMNKDEEDFQKLSYLISFIEGFLRLKIIPVREESLFTFRLRIERIFTCIKEQLSNKEKEN